MNKRLRQLMLEAGYAAPELAGRGQKLAELLVKECASLADCPNSFKHRSGAKIRKYFGVGNDQGST